MKIDKLRLDHFRSYEKQVFEFDTKTVIVGNNGSGKSNIMEAIYMLACGKSFRADADGEMVRYGAQNANVQGSISSVRLRIFIGDGSVPGVRKRFFVDEIPRRGMDFAGKLKAVLFGPADLELVSGSPSNRRRYLDLVLGQKDREYRRCLTAYEKGLRQRNKLLDFIREGTADRSQLYYWDRLLIKNGGYITDARMEYLRKFSDLGGKYRTVYDKSVISEERLKQYEVAELGAGSTLVGPHRDDFQVMKNSKTQKIENSNQEKNQVEVTDNFFDVFKFGSRGEQRMGVLALKLWERDYLSSHQDSVDSFQSELPVLLLDDVFSELDHRHRDEVLKLLDDQVKRGGQVIMTTADEHLVPNGVEWKKIVIQ